MPTATRLLIEAPNQPAAPRRSTPVLIQYFLCLFLLTRCLIAQAQFTYTTNNGAITITGYSGAATNLNIPRTIDRLAVRAIGIEAFSGRSTLSSVTIPESVTNIGHSAFTYCYSLMAISVDKANPFFSSESGILFNKGQTALIQYPISRLGASYVIPNSVTTIGDFSFYDCTGLTSVTIPNSVATIGDVAFYGCFGLTNVTIPNSTTTIGHSAFMLCSSLANMDVPSSVTNIGYSAFYGCTSLTDVTIPNSVTSIKESTFYSCSSLTNVNVPINVTTIGNSAFASCLRLIGVTIPDSITAIGPGAFESCYRLASVTIPHSVTNIAQGTFYSCTCLTNVIIPNGVTTIGNSAFNSCYSLISVTLPNSITSIGNNVFADCYTLKTACFTGNQPPTPSGLFDSSSPTVYYLPGTTGWGPTYGGRPALLWNPTASTGDSGFGVKEGKFGFNISGSPDITVVVEACSDLANPVWLPISTHTLTGGSSSFSDASWTNHASRIYRFRSP